MSCCCCEVRKKRLWKDIFFGTPEGKLNFQPAYMTSHSHTSSLHDDLLDFVKSAGFIEVHHCVTVRDNKREQHGLSSVKTVGFSLTFCWF